MDELLRTNGIPQYLQGLLGLMGVYSISDLTEINEEFLVSIETSVRQGAFDAQVDFKSKQNRIKYFGSDYAQLAEFSFRPLDRKKLLRLPELARAKLDSIEDTSNK